MPKETESAQDFDFFNTHEHALPEKIDLDELFSKSGQKKANDFMFGEMTSTFSKTPSIRKEIVEALGSIRAYLQAENQLDFIEKKIINPKDPGTESEMLKKISQKIKTRFKNSPELLNFFETHSSLISEIVRQSQNETIDSDTDRIAAISNIDLKGGKVKAVYEAPKEETRQVAFSTISITDIRDTLRETQQSKNPNKDEQFQIKYALERLREYVDPFLEAGAIIGGLKPINPEGNTAETRIDAFHDIQLLLDFGGIMLDANKRAESVIHTLKEQESNPQ
ncbi:MAG TPA: hypothetical protein PLV72_00830 [Candidatus Magasanikbacteria bacterium]|nr:hypothetical protein [Candidatus Magasanikbacteria bacterium]